MRNQEQGSLFGIVCTESEPLASGFCLFVSDGGSINQNQNQMGVQDFAVSFFTPDSNPAKPHGR